MKDEIYVSTDIEADGPIPGPSSMLSFASAAYRADKTLVGTFARNLTTLPDAVPDPKTEVWWKSQPEAWAACRKDLTEPSVAMNDYVVSLRRRFTRVVHRLRTRLCTDGTSRAMHFAKWSDLHKPFARLRMAWKLLRADHARGTQPPLEENDR